MLHNPLGNRRGELLEAADLVLTVSEGLQARRRVRNENTYLVRNGVDYPLFASAQDPDTSIAEELREIRGPIIGCVTRIVPEYFDAELLRTVFSARPDWSFVVVGPKCSESPALAELEALPNVYLLGRRPLTELPLYLKAFDACLIPYVLTENKRLADPMKLDRAQGAAPPHGGVEPVAAGFSEIKKSDIPKSTGAYKALRKARSDAKLVGVREKRAKDKADAEAANKK